MPGDSGMLTQRVWDMTKSHFPSRTVIWSRPAHSLVTRNRLECHFFLANLAKTMLLAAKGKTDFVGSQHPCPVFVESWSPVFHITPVLSTGGADCGRLLGFSRTCRDWLVTRKSNRSVLSRGLYFPRFVRRRVAIRSSTQGKSHRDLPSDPSSSTRTFFFPPRAAFSSLAENSPWGVCSQDVSVLARGFNITHWTSKTCPLAHPDRTSFRFGSFIIWSLPPFQWSLPGVFGVKR